MIDRTIARTLLVALVLVTPFIVFSPSSLALAFASSANDPAACTLKGAEGAPESSPVDPEVSASATPAATLDSVADVPLPGGATRFDYQSLDPSTGLLYLAHMDDGEVVVFDTHAQQVVTTIGDLSKVTGVLVVPELDRLYASAAGTHDVAVIDTTKNAIIARVGDIEFPDGLDYAPQANQIYVSDEAGGGETVIDAETNTVVETIDIGGEAGNTRYDPGSGCILIAVQSQNQLVAIDPESNRISARYHLESRCDGPHGIALDVEHRLAFLGCENNATLLTLDLASIRTVSVLAVGDGPDVLAFDPEWKRLYVATESGTVSLIDERQGIPEIAGTYQAPHAHSVSVDPETHLVYLPLQDLHGNPVLRIAQASEPGDR
jgi:DNA-binding beta-propeller fold protein YncE